MTYEEFQAGLAETPELINEIYEKHQDGYTKHLTDGKKMVVTTMDEYTKNTQKAVDEATKRNHSDWESKIEKVTGLKRPEGKKGLEWFDEISTKLKYLENDGDTESPLYKGLKKELEDLKTERSNEKRELAKAKIDGAINAAVAKLNFAVPSHVKKDDDKAAYQRREAEDSTDIFNARYTAEFVDGKLVFTNKKGEAQTENGEPMTAEAIFARDFSTKLEPKGRSQGGSGSGNDDQQQHGNADYLGATTEEIRKKIAEMGHGLGTDKWSELYTKAHIAAGYQKTDNGYIKK